jgi:pimeloyl-ACP methyl ester carboxylesterase
MTVFSDHTIELSQLTFHYRETGNPDAPPVVLLHGLMYDARDWDEIASFLAEHYHVLALTQRGHGESAGPANTPSSWDTAISKNSPMRFPWADSR